MTAPADRHRVIAVTRRALVLAGLAAAAVGCKDRTAQVVEQLERPAGGCVLDRAETLELDWEKPDGCGAEDAQCRDACLAGDAASCLARAFSVQKLTDREEESTLLFLRACERGLAIACTNYAAALWASSTSEPSQACAARLFEATCAVKEPFGCGMSGRMILDAAEGPDEIARGRSVLERGCKEAGGFACRALALHLESGELGPVDPKRIVELLARACETGDEDACGTHAKAADTFTPPAGDAGAK
ncbi:MAG TPA: hypothetical protein VMZ28_27420 [Kofleriaceae bacterium]|nr:hypothetical protein [Kofleriaceae bacterium]